MRYLYALAGAVAWLFISTMILGSINAENFMRSPDHGLEAVQSLTPGDIIQRANEGGKLVWVVATPIGSLEMQNTPMLLLHLGFIALPILLMIALAVRAKKPIRSAGKL